MLAICVCLWFTCWLVCFVDLLCCLYLSVVLRDYCGGLCVCCRCGMPGYFCRFVATRFVADGFLDFLVWVWFVTAVFCVVCVCVV